MTGKSWGGIKGILDHVADQATRPLPAEIDNLGKTVIANIASSMQRANHPPLLAEDGATFHAYIQSAPGGQFQAACYAQLDKNSSVSQEAPTYGIFNSKREAHIWVHQQAANRKFDSIFWADEFSAEPA